MINPNNQHREIQDERLISTINTPPASLFISFYLGLLSCAILGFIGFVYFTNRMFDLNGNVYKSFLLLSGIGSIAAIVGICAASAGIWIEISKTPDERTKSLVVRYSGLVLSSIGCINFLIAVILFAPLFLWFYFLFLFRGAGSM